MFRKGASGGPGASPESSRSASRCCSGQDGHPGYAARAAVTPGTYTVAFPVRRKRDEKVKYLGVHECFMNFRLLSALMVVLLAFSLCAGCTGSGEPSGQSPRETVEITATPAPTTSVSLTPGPTQTVPPGKEVGFQLTGGYPSRVTNDLYIAFRGGKGQDFITSIDVRVTKSTGEVITETLRAVSGDELIIHNAKGENRVEITVALVTGGSYKVIDQIVEVP